VEIFTTSIIHYYVSLIGCKYSPTAENVVFCRKPSVFKLQNKRAHIDFLYAVH